MVRATWLPEIIRGVKLDQQWGEVMTNDQFNNEIIAWKRSLPNFLCSHCRKAAMVTVKDYPKWVKKTEAGIAITGKHTTGPVNVVNAEVPVDVGMEEGVILEPVLLECKD